MTEVEQNILILKDLKNKITKSYESEIGKINVILLELFKNCSHSETEIEERQITGGYYDRAEYIKTTKCVVCGKTLNEEIKYGGYG